MQSRSHLLPPSLCRGPELCLKVIVVLLCVTHHNTADDPDDAHHKKYSTEIPGPIRDHIDQVPGYSKREHNET